MMTLAIPDMPAASTLFQGRRLSLLSSPFPSPTHSYSHNQPVFRVVVDCFYNHRSAGLLSVCFSSPSPSPPSSDGQEGDGYYYDYEKQKQEAVEAVSDILQENGVSEKESMEIAMNSPKYVEMLMDSIRDLDQLYQSTSSSSSSSSAVNYNYKKKITEMGKRKGDKGLVPLLESMVGLPLPAAIHIARYLSPTPTSPNLLLYKIKYLKEILFSNDVTKKTKIATNARRMMMHLSIQVDEDVQQTLSFLEKVCMFSTFHGSKLAVCMCFCFVSFFYL